VWQTAEAAGQGRGQQPPDSRTTDSRPARADKNRSRRDQPTKRERERGGIQVVVLCRCEGQGLRQEDEKSDGGKSQGEHEEA